MNNLPSAFAVVIASDSGDRLHEVRSVASQIAFVSYGQGIALVPASMKKMAPANVVFRPLSQRLNVVTTAVAWNAERPNPLIDEIIAWFRDRP